MGGNDKGFSEHSRQQQPDHPLRFPVTQLRPRQLDLPAGVLTYHFRFLILDCRLDC
jgi:hypothetical protein